MRSDLHDFQTPYGAFRVRASSSAIIEISRIEHSTSASALSTPADFPLLLEARQQVLDFLSGHRHQFDLPLSPEGTSFQRKVWTELQKLKWGETLTYAELAQKIGSPTAARAVGSAVGKNPILFAIPCHRIVAANGRLGGFSAGLDLKIALLALESGRSTSFSAARADSSSQLHI